MMAGRLVKRLQTEDAKRGAEESESRDVMLDLPGVDSCHKVIRFLGDVGSSQLIHDTFEQRTVALMSFCGCIPLEDEGCRTGIELARRVYVAGVAYAFGATLPRCFVKLKQRVKPFFLLASPSTKRRADAR